MVSFGGIFNKFFVFETEFRLYPISSKASAKGRKKQEKQLMTQKINMIRI